MPGRTKKEMQEVAARGRAMLAKRRAEGIPRLVPTKQDVFIASFVGEARYNATMAARMAGYKSPERAGLEMVKTPRIVQRIKDAMGAKAMSPEEVVAHVSDIARSRPAEGILRFEPARRDDGSVVLDKDGKQVEQAFIDLAKARDAGLLGMIKQIRQTRYGIDVTFYDRLQALETLARIHKLFGEQGTLTFNQLEVVVGDPRAMEEVRARRALAAPVILEGSVGEPEEGNEE